MKFDQDGACKAGASITRRGPARWLHISAAARALLAALFLACGLARAASDSAPETVLAAVGEQKITQQQVEQMILQQYLRGLDPNRLYESRKRALDELIGDRLISQAAAKAGMSPEEYVARESGAGAKVTESDARKFYEQNKARLKAQSGGESFEQLKAPLMAFLQKRRDQELRAQLITKLKERTAIKVTLAVPRVQVHADGHPSIGGKPGAVTIVEFGDYQCPFCRAAEYSIRTVRAKYGDKVRVVFADFPLPMHQHAMDAARAGRCADRQGKFWQLHDALFAEQTKLAPADLKAAARKLGLDGGQFDACFDSRAPDAGIQKDLEQGHALGVTATPTFFVNGRQLTGALPPARFEELIDDDLAHSPPSAAETAQDHAGIR